MIIIIYAILVIAIRDLSPRWNNKKLVAEKSTVWFELTR